MSPNLVPYLRVSTSRQGVSGLGLDAQREALRRYANAVGATLLPEHIEVETGKRADRPVLVAAIEECRRTKATLAIAKLDRLARSVAFIAGLMEAKVPFIAVDMPSATPLMLHVMAAFAQYEREQISQRTREALAAAKARGVVLGENGRRLAHTNKEAARAYACSLRDAVDQAQGVGATSLQSLANWLNENGHQTREGAAWSPATVRRLLGRLEPVQQQSDSPSNVGGASGEPTRRLSCASRRATG